MTETRAAISSFTASLIGLAVVAVAGILLSQIYLSHSSMVSHRPALMVEYVDVLDAGDRVLVAVNVKNIGGVEELGGCGGSNVLCCTWF